MAANEDGEALSHQEVKAGRDAYVAGGDLTVHLAPSAGTGDQNGPAPRFDRTAGLQFGSGNTQVNHFHHSPTGDHPGGAPGAAGSRAPHLAGEQLPPKPGDGLEELYMRAIDQLGSERALVRLGALHVLGRLGQGNPGLRETVIKVVCAYLRMPYDLPAPGRAYQSGRREELQVRLAAQSIVADHLRDPADRVNGTSPGSFWPEIELIDLDGAHLVDFNLSGCRVDSLNCNSTVLSGESLFRGMRCELAFFQSAEFRGHADFRGAAFANDTWFSNAAFASDVWFHGDEFFPPARFEGHASFKNVKFTQPARFEQAVFGRSADFEGVTCGGGDGVIGMQGAQVPHPDAVSPEVSGAPSTWPSGWVAKPAKDGTAVMTWRGL